MSDVKGRRRYDASGRQEQARRNRSVILDAARRSFLDVGYAATTMPAVAASAGVSVETVYKAFGNKAGLAKSVFDVAIVGDDEPVPLMERDFVRRNMAEPDPSVKLRDYGEHLAETSARSHPVMLVIRDAALTDSGAAAVWSKLDEERRTGMGHFATHLRDGGHLREGVSLDEATDVLWTYISVEVWDLLVNQCGWDQDRYGRWISEQLIAALLEGGSE